MDTAALHDGNRDAWDRTARVGYASGSIDEHIVFLRAGGVHLEEPELRILGDLRDWCRRAIHLQCSHGLDALSLVNFGAEEVIGIDISGEMLAAARAKSEALAAPAMWIQADVLDTPHSLDGTADLVYTGRGAICWMMDLAAWAAVVARLLRPGGRFFIFEGHPLDFLWNTDAAEFEFIPGATYFQRTSQPEFGFPFGAARRENPDVEVRLTSRVWTLGEVVTTLIRAGLRVDLLEEYPLMFWNQFPNIPAEEAGQLPHTFALFMTKPE